MEWTDVAHPYQEGAEAVGQKAALGLPTVLKRTREGRQDPPHLRCLERSGPQASPSIQWREYEVG